MDVRRFTVRVPGHWEDAWLYRENLLVWDRQGSLYYVPIDSLRAQVARAQDHHHAVLADHLVFRSERKSSREFQDLFAITAVRERFLEPLAIGPETVVSIDASTFQQASIEPIPGNMTDTVAYGNRLFTTSDAGVFETQFDSRFDTQSPLLQVHTAPATAIVAGNGQFAASLGEVGLVTREVGFGDGDQWVDSVRDRVLETLAPYSRSVTRSSVHLVNYGESPVPDFIRATTQIERRANGFTETIVTDFDEPASLDQSLREVIGNHLTVDEVRAGEGFEVLGNANYRLLLLIGHEVRVLNMLARRDRALRVDPYRKIDVGQTMPNPFAHALSTQALRSGFLVEHVGGVHVLGDSGVTELADELVVQARTFPNSRRYVDTVILVREHSLDLVGFIDIDP
ncbi:hypothetical protein [Microbacterium aerolatum]|uniref:hypothetical protein n=1 Tax=Microbacterium aerolatum TaxID=153731 RepID=UPI0011BDAE51|nr:hypothetical protein [Microbacterium aerolatum]GGB22139.1 hypothetical protein GCM10007198_10760 [Microbacterium aerolatum]